MRPINPLTLRYTRILLSKEGLEITPEEAIGLVGVPPTCFKAQKKWVYQLSCILSARTLTSNKDINHG